MPFIYEIDRLRDIIEQFHKLTGLTLSVYDLEFRSIIASPEALTPYCTMLWGNDTTKQKCHDSDIIACRRCTALRHSVTYTCHAGISETVIPILFHDSIYGFIIFGQYADAEKVYSSPKTVLEAAEKYAFPAEEMLARYDKLIKLTHAQIEGATKLLEMCTLKIYMDQLIRSETSNMFFEITEYIHDHIGEELTVNSICDHFFISKNRLYTVFHENSNTTFMRYVIAKRVEKAKRMLANDKKSIAEIAEEVGFQDYNYFIQTFKKQEKITPHLFRKTVIDKHSHPFPLEIEEKNEKRTRKNKNRKKS